MVLAHFIHVSGIKGRDKTLFHAREEYTLPQEVFIG